MSFHNFFLAYLNYVLRCFFRFRLISTNVIKNALKEKKFNLYLAYKLLQSKPESRVVRRRDNEIRKYGKPPEDFYEEVLIDLSTYFTISLKLIFI